MNLLMLADSLAYSTNQGKQPIDTATLYPNALRAELQARSGTSWHLSVFAAAGVSTGELQLLLRRDDELRRAVAASNAIVLAVASMDYLRVFVPPTVAKKVRRMHSPVVAKAVASAWPHVRWVIGRVRMPRSHLTPPARFPLLVCEILDELVGLAPAAALVALGPSPFLGPQRMLWGTDEDRDEYAAAERDVVTRAGFAFVDPVDYLDPWRNRGGSGDNIHWPAPAHIVVAHALADAVLGQVAPARARSSSLDASPRWWGRGFDPNSAASSFDYREPNSGG